MGNSGAGKNVNERSINNIISDLKKARLIERVGSNKTGF